MSGFRYKWNHFWFELRSTQSLCLLRIFFGSVFLMKMTGFSNLQHVGSLRARFPRHHFTEESDYYLGAFRLPVPGFEWLPVPDLWQHQLLEYVLLFAGIFFVLGLATRASAVTIAVIWNYQFLLSQWTYRHHVMVIAITMLIFAFSRCDDHYSITAYLRGPRAPRPRRPYLPVRLLQATLSIIYLFSFAGKLNPSWFSGDVMLIFYDQDSIDGDFRDLTDWLFSWSLLQPFHETALRSLAWFTLLVEGFLAFGFWIPRLRGFAILCGLALHLGIDLTMSVATFSFQMFALYIVFIEPESCQHRAYFDGSIERAIRRARWCQLLDWFRRFEWIDVSTASPERLRHAPPPDDLQDTIVVIGNDGHTRRGYPALVWLCSRFPLTFIPSWILWAPGFAHVGRGVFGVLYSRSRESRSRPGAA